MTLAATRVSPEIRPATGPWAARNRPQTQWQGVRVWLVGASSGIGRAVAHALHGQGAQVIVSARNAQALEAFRVGHPGAQVLALDVRDGESVRLAAQSLLARGPLDWVFYCAGHYAPMQAASFDLAQALGHVRINYDGALHVINAVMPQMMARQSGHISLVSSVAGFRGLPRSLAYGPTKAALINLAEALYLELQSHGVGVSLVNPGFVATGLTARNDFRMPALITPEEAAAQILAGWGKGRFEIHFPRRFTLGMKALQLLPFGLYQAIVRRYTGL